MTLIYKCALFTWSLGVFITTCSILSILENKRQFKARFFNIENHVIPRISTNTFYAHLKSKYEHRLKFIGLTWSAEKFIVFLALLGAVGAGISYKYFNNPMTSLPMAGAFSFILYGYINYSVLKKKDLLEKQLIPAIQVFLSEFGSLPNIVSALSKTLIKVDEPLKEELDRLVRDMNSGRGTEEALFSFAQRVQSPWAYRLAHILNLRINKGINISPMLFNLYLDMKTKVVKEKERSMEGIGVRLESYLLYVFIPIMYYMAVKINPQTHYLLTQTSEGRKVMLYLTILLLVGVISTIRLGNNRIR